MLSHRGFCLCFHGGFFNYMAKKIKYQLIKSGRSYKVTELAATLNVHVRTVQEWIKRGLPIIDRNSKPYLISGYEAKIFLKECIDSKKVKLNKDEIFCLKCRQPRKSIPEEVKCEYTGRLIGHGQRQIIITGKCPNCLTPLQRFSSDKNITQIVKSAIIKENILIFNGDGS